MFMTAVFDFGEISKKGIKEDICYRNMCEVADALLNDGWGIYYLSSEEIETEKKYIRISYEELGNIRNIDVWISLENELPDVVKRIPLMLKYVLIRNVYRYIYEKQIKDEYGKIPYSIDYISNAYDYIVCANDSDYEEYKNFFTNDLNQCVICSGSANDIYSDITQRVEKKKNEPLVTIVTITHNLINARREEMIDECIKSIDKQSYKNIEHIIIDGASYDGTIDLLKKYGEKIIIYSEKDNGVYDAMNKGIKKTHGKYVAFMNSDDRYSDEKAIEYSVAKLEMHEADYSFSDVKIIYEDKTTYKWMADINNLAFGTHYCHQSMLIKTEILRRYNGFDERYRVSADSDLMIRLYKDRYKFVYIPQILVDYRSGGLSEKNREESRHNHAESFFFNIGKDLGLTMTDCMELWQLSFLKSMSLNQRINVIKKVSIRFDVNRILSVAIKGKPLTKTIVDRLVEKKIIKIKRKEIGKKRIIIAFLFGSFPCLVKINNV